MKRRGFRWRVAFPILLIAGVMIVSIHVYNLSRNIENRTLHFFLSNVGAVFMFLSIWLGAMFGNTIAFFKGASFGERVLVCLVPPLIWCSKILYDFIGIYSPGEFLFLLFHHFILGCPLVALFCMGLSEIWCRIIARRKPGYGPIRVFALSNTLMLIISFAAISLMLWNGGHSYYYLYMDMYTKLFL